MSCKLWEYFLQDDVESFSRYLSSSQRSGGNNAVSSIPPHKFGSPGTALGSSPSSPLRGRKLASTSPGSPLSDRTLLAPQAPLSQQPHPSSGGGFRLTKADVNSRDRFGRTLLHLAASSQKESAYDFVEDLLAIPFIDVYAQDLESGWTPLHRALYAGNVAIAQALMARDIKGAIDFSTPGGGHHHLSGGLIKIKDREGNSPFDVFAATVTARDINDSNLPGHQHLQTSDSVSESSDDEAESVREEPTLVRMRANLMGDEVFTFGSNKNLTLGLGDEDDRQFPARVILSRPDDLLYRLNREHESRHKLPGSAVEHKEYDNIADLPILVRSQPLIYQDIIMSKLHTGIITNDPESNLFMSGFGPGGRLGTGDEATRFSFVCIQAGGLAGKKVVALALGQDHSIAVSQRGELFTWGSNKYGQLGYTLPKSNHKNDVPIQTTPRQIFNPFKKEVIVGAAASSIHSVVFTSTGLYTFGKNEGQLGLIDADARSLESQVIPRKVGASLFASPIAMVAAIDRATTCLLENHEVWVFTHYGYSRLVFPLDGASAFLRDSFLTTRYGKTINCITKIIAGGNTICAMSSFGEVYTINVSKKADTSSTAASTTNPAKIRNSLPQPSRVWSVKKSHMAVRDVDVGQDGSIIICTASGSAWRKEKRAKIKTTGASNTADPRLKDYKFVRIPGLSRVVAVRSNAFGAYAAVQYGCEVTKEQIIVSRRTLWDDIWPLLPFKALLVRESEREVSVKTEYGRVSEPQAKDSEKKITPETILRESTKSQVSSNAFEDAVWISSTSSDVRIPVHEFMIGARSPVLLRALRKFRESYYYSIPDCLAIEYGKDGEIQIQFQDFNFLSIFNLVLFIYTDQVYEVWTELRSDVRSAPLYRQVRAEVIKLASQLELRGLEEATRIMFQPRLTLNADMERAIQEPHFFDSADALIELDGAEVRAHSQILCQRCPFFEGLFYGRAAGRWVSARRERADSGDAVRIDLKHIDPKVFAFVLRHIYADTNEELFADVREDSLDDLVDLVIDVMAVANELMLDRLTLVCQKLLGQFVNTRNVCHFLNAVAACTVTSFKEAAFEFICLNLEVMLENKLLDDLDAELLGELDAVCQENQLTCLPVSRGRNTLEFIVERYPEIAPLLEQDRQRQIDSMRLGSRLHEDEIREEKFHAGSFEKPSTVSPLAQKSKQPAPSTEAKLVPESPLLRSKQSTGDLIFQMDDESVLSPPTPKMHAETTPKPRHTPAPVTPNAKATPDDSGFLGGQSTSPSFYDLPQPAFSKGKQAATTGSPAHTETPLSKAPWVMQDSPNVKADLSDIMAEASTSKQAPIERGFVPRKESGNFAAAKMSQKERKKLKQQQMRDDVLSPSESSKQKSSASPWQPISSGSKGPPPVDDAAQDDQQSRTPSQTRATSKAALTLRQTVAGTPPPSQSPLSTKKQTPQQPTQSTPPRPSPKQEITTHSPSQFQSPAYVPTPSELPRPTSTSTSTSTAPQQHLSLASILHEQQTEKDIIREAATAKHNLHDIQVEQEFKEWWDKESKLVMQEEADAAAAAAAASAARGAGRGSGRRGRGGAAGRGGGGMKGKGRAGDQQQNHQQQGGEGIAGHPVPVSSSSMVPDENKNRHRPGAGEKQMRGTQERGRKAGHHPAAPPGRGKGGGGRGRVKENS